MGEKIAIDFGTTNSVVARWDSNKEDAEVISVDKISDITVTDRPPIVPSLLYVDNAQASNFTIGQAVREQGKDAQKNNRLFRNFKRGIVATPAPEPRDIDARQFADKDAGAHFLKEILQIIPYADTEIEQLVLTAPVAAFEGYLAWLNQVIDEIAPNKIRVVDESTAAALGYAVTEPGAVVLVFDFGGGTLDLSLVQLPEHKRKTGGFLSNLLGGGENAAKNAARVIAKAGRVIGGSDIDQWLLQYVLLKTKVSISELGSNYAPLLTECERAKIALSTEEIVEINFEADGKAHTLSIKREDLETLLEDNEFYTALRKVVDKVMHVARQRGIFKEDIKYVLMVGGTSLMPSVQSTLAKYFTDMAVRADKPFTAVAEGALQLAAGFGLEDYLVHSYGLRHLDDSDTHDWDEIISMGSSYPLDKPIEVLLSAAHENQEAIEFIIGEIDTEAVSMVEVKYEDGQAVFVADTTDSEHQIIPMNELEALNMLAKLEPPGKPGETRLKVDFTVDDRRQLRMTVYDLKKKKVLIEDVAVVTLQ